MEPTALGASPVAVIKHHDQRTFRRKFVVVMVTESWNSPWLWQHPWPWVAAEAEGRQLMPSTASTKQRENCKQARLLLSIKAHPQGWIPSSSKASSPHLLKSAIDWAPSIQIPKTIWSFSIQIIYLLLYIIKTLLKSKKCVAVWCKSQRIS